MAEDAKDHQGTVLSNAYQTLLTFNTGLLPGGAVLQNVQLVNNGAVDRVVDVQLIPQAQVASAQYLIGRVTVPANDTVPLPGGPWYGGDASFVQAKQDAGTDVTARCTAFERS
jgi:hypothetical protein